MSNPKREIRRNRDSADFLHEIRGLKSLGYSVPRIAEKADCCESSVESMFYLLKNGHPSLIADVEHGHIPHTIALQISRTKNPELQIILANGFKAGTVNTSQIVTIRQRVDEHHRDTRQRDRRSDADSIIRMFSNEADARMQFIQRAKLVKSRLEFIAGALQQLFSDQRFVGLLRAEDIHTVPSWLAERINGSNERCSVNSAPKSLDVLLKDKPVSTLARNILLRMNPTRQVEAAEFMVSAGNFSRIFALALLLATKQEDRVARRAKPILGLSRERIANMQQDLECLLKDSAATENYGTDVLSLVSASGYVSRLISNEAIESYLHQNHPDVLQQFRTIFVTVSLDHSLAEHA
jgi:hypothetical protein